MLLDVTESQLVLVDYQERLMPAIFEGPAVLANARRLAVPTPGRGVRFLVGDVVEALRRERDGVTLQPAVRRRKDEARRVHIE